MDLILELELDWFLALFLRYSAKFLALFLRYSAKKFLDTVLPKLRKRREQKHLGETVLPAHGHDPSLQIIHVNVTVRGPNHKLDARLKDNVFPEAIRTAIAQPALDELSELMKTRQAQKALAYAKRHIERIDTALNKYEDPERRYAEALRTHRQRLLFAAATAASWQGDIEAGRAFWWRARDLGPIDSEWHEQAAATLFNIELKDELRHLMAEMDQRNDAYRRSVPLLAYLDEDWPSVDKLLADSQSADLLLMRVQARLQILDPTDIEAVELTAELIDRTDDDVILPIVNIARAWFTLELLQLVTGGYTLLDYKRRPLIDSLVRRINVALDSTEPNSALRAQILNCMGMAAKLLRDETLIEIGTRGVEALDDTIRSSVFFEYDAAPTLKEIDEMLATGQIDAIRAVLLKTTHYHAAGKPEEVERVLREGLFATPDKRQRAHVLRLLAQHLRQTNRIDEAQRLIESIPLRPADRWLLRAENLPIGRTPLDLADEVAAFPLDVDVIERLAQFTLSTVKPTSPEDPPPDATILDRAEEAVHWTTRLVEILPSRSSRFLHAQALYGARRYSDLLTASRNLDPVYAKQATELEAWALVGLGHRAKAADLLVSACANHPDSERLAINASGLLMAEGRPAEAADLLESRVTADSKVPEILVAYALAIRAQAPSSHEEASQAFDLLARANDLRPDPRIAQEAWKAARAAQRQPEARRFFKAMTADAPVKVVQTKDDFYQAMQAVSDTRAVQIEGGLEYLAELIRKDREHSGLLSKFLSGHALAYVDFFRLSRRSWELWTYWAQQYERRCAEGEVSPGKFSILADWPSLHLGYGHRHDAGDIKLFADQTAILTLGVLGPDTAKQILAALGTCYVHTGMLEELRQDLTRINGHLLVGSAGLYVKAAHFLSQRSGTIVSYSGEVQSAAPNDPSVGPRRVDLGVAILHDALYATDIDKSQDWPDEANRLRISSATLLASLNAAGEVTANEARNAAGKYPSAFEGWDSATPRPIPTAIVFDEFSILDWVDAGLADVLGDRAKVGPWAWMRISDEVARQQAMELAHERLQGTIEVFQSALAEGAVVEIRAATDGKTHEAADAIPTGSPSPIESLWSGALRSLRTAQAHGLQLWADDRFYPLLLRLGGPTEMGPDIQAIRDPFVAWAKEAPPIAITELLSRLTSLERLAPDVAQDAVAKLFAQGYRMAHPILLLHTIRQFPVPSTGPLTRPFQNLVNAITEIPRYLPETFDLYYNNRDGFVRMASMGVAERFIVGVWEAEGLSNDQRCALANAFLEAVEHVFEEASPNAVSARADRTPIIFWRGVASGLQMMPAQDERRFELRYAALCWLGKAAASRAEQHEDIVRVLEDNALDFLDNVLGALDDRDKGEHLPQAIGKALLPALLPLVNTTSLSSILDPLLRRAVGTLARFNRDGRITKLYYATADRDGTPLKVSEEDNEQAAVEALARAVSGDPKCAQFIKATDLVFRYTRPAPEEWTDTGFPTDERFPIDVRCSLFTLLWVDPPSLREIIVRLVVYYLSTLDPALAYRILIAEGNLLSNDSERAREARDWLAIDVLRSGYFDLQRDLVHAVRRFRQYDTGAFAQFVGWIGEEAAHALANHPLTPQVRQIGPLLVPMGHFLGRALLTDGGDDGDQVLEMAQQINDADDESNEDNTTLPELAAWLADRVSVAETVDDPFVAAWALRAVLLVLSTMNQNPELDIDGRLIKASDWVASYVAAALSEKTGQLSELEQRMTNRRQLASAALQLAAFACSGDKHFHAYNQEDDPVAIWLDLVWLLATKLQIALVGLRGGLANAARAATTALQDLGLATPDARVLDAFDPFAFGSDGDDIGMALTLTAMLKVVHQLRETSEPPLWWTNTVRRRAEELANAGSKKSLTGDEELDNRFGLIAPLRVRILAQQLTVALTS